MATGVIKRLVADRGFGFIRQDGNWDNDLFFHRSAVKDAAFEELGEGLPVSFKVTQGPKGPRAEDVSVGN